MQSCMSCMQQVHALLACVVARVSVQYREGREGVCASFNIKDPFAKTLPQNEGGVGVGK